MTTFGSFHWNGRQAVGAVRGSNDFFFPSYFLFLDLVQLPYYQKGNKGNDQEMNHMIQEHP